MRGEALLKALSFYNKAWDSDTQSMSRKQAKPFTRNYRLSLNIAVQMESLPLVEPECKPCSRIASLDSWLTSLKVESANVVMSLPNDVPSLSRFINICEERLQKTNLEEPKNSFREEASSDWIKYFNETETGQKPEALGKSTQRLGVSLNKQQGSLVCSRFLKI